MTNLTHLPDTLIRKFARFKGYQTKRGQSTEDIISNLEASGLMDDLTYLNNQFKFATTSTALTLLKPLDDFQYESASLFIADLISRGMIAEDQVGSEWQPALSAQIKICGIECNGEDVYIKMVQEIPTTRKQGYASIPSTYAHFTAAVIHFNNKTVQIRAAYKYRQGCMNYLYDLLGLRAECESIFLTKITKEEASAISAILQAGLASTHVSIPSSVGSIRFNATKGIDLRGDPTFVKIKEKFKELGLPTDETLDEVIEFDFIDPQTAMSIYVSFEINIQNGAFKFTKLVSERAIEQVLEAFFIVCFLQKQHELEAQEQSAAGSE